MGCEVYANDDEIACKAGDGKVIAAFPDVCLSPPSPPAGPIPVPYPNTSFSKDMQNGSKTVMINGKEVMLKDQSFYKTSPLGDEAATNGLGAGVITHVITGKTYFVAWSMDVKFEGQNVDRHTDITTSNHASPTGNAGVPMANLSTLAQQRIMADQCPCCGNAPHSKAQADDIAGMKQGKPSTSISEDEWYGFQDFTSTKSGVTVKPLNNAQKRGRADIRQKCPKQFAEANSDCGFYYVIDQDEKDDIDRVWKGTPGREARTKIGAAAGEQVSHRVPRAAGGCPTGSGNLTKSSDLSPECQNWEGTLGTYQAERYRELSKTL